MTRISRVAVAVIVVVAVAMPLSAAVYTWKDKNGTVVISSSPRRDSAPTPAPTRKEPVREQKRYPDVRVTMYKTDWCPYCKKAKNDLNALGVNLTEYDVERDQGRADEMRRKGGSGVPFIDVEGIYIAGYDAYAIKAAVEKRQTAK